VGNVGADGSRTALADLEVGAGGLEGRHGPTAGHCGPGRVVLRGQIGLAGAARICLPTLDAGRDIVSVLDTAVGRRGSGDRPVRVAPATLGAGRAVWVWLFCD